ncbi:MAG: hypothetical protein GQ530_00035 [Desulfuromonadales bacterium]|nr:hypothetical protein [Desulfuromonadales bacterium]
MSIRRNISLKHPLILLYVLVLLILVALLVNLQLRDYQPFSLSHAVITESRGTVVTEDQAGASLSIYGNDFHPGLKGVLAKNLVNEKAHLWHQLADVPSRGIIVKGELALVSCYKNKLVSIGLGKGEDPQFLGSIELPDTIKQIKIVGHQALVGMPRHTGLSLIDLQDPEALKLVAYFPVAGLVSSMAVDRSSVYFTDLYEGISRIDLSAKVPVPEKIVSLQSPWRIALQGKKLVVGTLKGRIHLFDIAQNGQLVEAGSLDFPVSVRGVALTEEVLAVALLDGTLHVFNVSSWPKLNKPVQLKLSGRPWQMEPVPGRARIAVSLAVGGLALIDVSRPESPTIAGHLKLPRTFMEMDLQAEKVYGVSNYGLEAFSLDEIENGEFSMLATEATIEQTYYKMKSWNGHVYGYSNMALVDFGKGISTDIDSAGRYMAVADKGDVSLFEQDEEGQVQRVGSLLMAEGAGTVKFRDNCIYMLHSGGLRIFSGARPGELVKKGELKLPGRCTHFEILDSGYLLVTTLDNGVLVVDVNAPQQPVEIARLVLPRHLQKDNVAQAVLVDGQRAYISQGRGGVHVVDVSVPSQPELLQIIETPGFAKNMALYDNLLLVADGAKGVFMIDVNDRDRALPIGSLPTPIRVSQIAVTEDGLIVSGHQGGTVKLALPQRLQNLQVISEDEMRADMERVEKGQYVYLYDERASGQVRVGDL